MSEIIQSVNLKDGNILEIYLDTTPSNPREDSNLGIIAGFHKRYSLADNNVSFKSDDFEGWDAMEEHICKVIKAVVCLPLYMYDHGGITIKTTPFGDRWDSGQIGFIYCTNSTISDIGLAIQNDDTWSSYKERLAKHLIAEVHTFDQYLTGDVYGFAIKNTDGEEQDSCWGFYGDDYKTNGMLDHVGKDNIKLDDL